MKSSEMLRNAAKQLWDGHGSCATGHIHICQYLESSYGDNSLHIRNLICQRLGRSPTVLHWLISRSFIKYNRFSNTEIQAYRKRWCLALADEFETKGD